MPEIPIGLVKTFEFHKCRNQKFWFILCCQKNQDLFSVSVVFAFLMRTSASATLDADGEVAGEMRYYPFGEMHISIRSIESRKM